MIETHRLEDVAIFYQLILSLVRSRNFKVTSTLKKPPYVGIRILNLSKVLMYEFHQDCSKSKYDNKSKLLFTDNDSLIQEIKTKYVYEDFSKDKESSNLVIILLA